MLMFCCNARIRYLELKCRESLYQLCNDSEMEEAKTH